VVGLICNLREFLWGSPTDLHFKGVFISPFLSLWLVNLKLLTIPIGSFFWTDSDSFAAGDISPWKLRNSRKAAFHIPVYRGRGSISKVEGHWPKWALLYMTRIKRFYDVHEPNENFLKYGVSITSEMVFKAIIHCSCFARAGGANSYSTCSVVAHRVHFLSAWMLADTPWKLNYIPLSWRARETDFSRD
jgi:hypothetical protein